MAIMDGHASFKWDTLEEKGFYLKKSFSPHGLYGHYDICLKHAIMKKCTIE